jgi:anti-sigma B factor antagonist
VKDPLAQLSFDEVGSVLVGRIDGEIESVNADQLRAALARRLTNESPGLVLDLSHAAYLDSAGVELLFDLARRLRTHRQRLRLVVPLAAPMRRVLDLCDIEAVAPMDATVDAAVEALRRPGD